MCTFMTNREYKERYLQDVNEHKDAEQITLQVLKNLNNGYIYEDVTKDESCYSKGDIKMIKDDTIKYIDVKDDARINETNNIFVDTCAAFYHYYINLISNTGYTYRILIGNIKVCQ